MGSIRIVNAYKLKSLNYSMRWRLHSLVWGFLLMQRQLWYWAFLYELTAMMLDCFSPKFEVSFCKPTMCGKCSHSKTSSLSVYQNGFFLLLQERMARHLAICHLESVFKKAENRHFQISVLINIKLIPTVFQFSKHFTKCNVWENYTHYEN